MTIKLNYFNTTATISIKIFFTMSKTKTTYNPFSKKLMNFIKGVYSEDTTYANESFMSLLDYFKNNLATKSEVHCLVMTNNNDIVKLLSDLSHLSEPYEILRATVGKVVSDAVTETLSLDYGLDLTGESTDI